MMIPDKKQFIAAVTNSILQIRANHSRLEFLQIQGQTLNELQNLNATTLVPCALLYFFTILSLSLTFAKVFTSCELPKTL
jgi:hypothetical protein